MRSTILPLLLSFALAGCYGKPQLPDTEATPEVTPEEPERAGRGPAEHGDASAAEERRAELEVVLSALTGTSGERSREAEIAKLREIIVASCRAGAAACRATLTDLVAADLPATDLWPVYGEFLGSLRPRAGEAAEVLGRSLLLSDDPDARDRAFRMAVGTGAARRGQHDEGDRRASSIPTQPRVGEPVLIVVEQVSPCGDIGVDLKGPDASGRFDLDLQLRCEPVTEPADGEPWVPMAGRAVWAFDAGPLTDTGMALWMAGAEEPLLSLSPAADPKKE